MKNQQQIIRRFRQIHLLLHSDPYGRIEIEKVDESGAIQLKEEFNIVEPGDRDVMNWTE